LNQAQVQAHKNIISSQKLPSYKRNTESTKHSQQSVATPARSGKGTVLAKLMTTGMKAWGIKETDVTNKKPAAKKKKKKGIYENDMIIIL